MRLAIGTAQFGRGYGVANKGGKVISSEIKKIFKIADENNVRMFDTAEDYGDSEEIIGKMSDGLGMDADVITKVFINPEDRDGFYKRLESSLKALRTESVYGLLSHDPSMFIEDSRVFSMIKSAKERGAARKIGVSVFTPEQANMIVEKYDVDIIQVPCNLLDQRFISSNTIKDLVGSGIEVHVRSIFLQGLFFTDNPDRYFDDIKDNLRDIRLFAGEKSMSVGKMALGFVKSIPGVSRIIVGMDNSDQFIKIIDDYNSYTHSYDFSGFSIDDDRFINPGKWNVGGWHKS